MPHYVGKIIFNGSTLVFRLCRAALYVYHIELVLFSRRPKNSFLKISGGPSLSLPSSMASRSLYFPSLLSSGCQTSLYCPVLPDADIKIDPIQLQKTPLQPPPNKWMPNLKHVFLKKLSNFSVKTSAISNFDVKKTIKLKTFLKYTRRKLM